MFIHFASCVHCAKSENEQEIFGFRLVWWLDHCCLPSLMLVRYSKQIWVRSRPFFALLVNPKVFPLVLVQLSPILQFVTLSSEADIPHLQFAVRAPSSAHSSYTLWIILLLVLRFAAQLLCLTHFVTSNMPRRNQPSVYAASFACKVLSSSGPFPCWFASSGCNFCLWLLKNGHAMLQLWFSPLVLLLVGLRYPTAFSLYVRWIIIC